LDDVVNSKETIIGFDGSVTISTIQDEYTGALTAEDQVESSDQESGVGPGQPVGFSSTAGGASANTDHSTGDDKFTGQNKSTDNGTVSTSVWRPVVSYSDSGM